MNLMSLSVKKSALAVIVCSILGSVVPAMADVGNPSLPVGGTSVSALTMHVVGVITNSTCNIRPYTAGGADATTLNLGVVVKGSTSVSPVSFFLKPENGCTDGIISAAGGKQGSTQAQITWESNGLTEHGISNMYGTAKNVHIVLSPVEGDGTTTAKIDSGGVGNGDAIKTGSQTVNYKALANGSSANAFKYEVKLAKNDDATDMGAGTVDTDISYTVAYL
ncbi:hypothetical protein ATT74_22085 [Salmonella enterica subsp. enterica serovar Panama]|uniref:Fimbrial protein n=1 Tax=Salmonella enterica subsp. enterica serovar Panama TaxID=29472 RepID=A0A619AH75_SALET|nr:hypothetical protein [Salmonella enterica subsp. enterica serovar Panama]EGU5383791.1 hypothetical protein [Salmonella enterica]ECX3497847.1 hypothetical protein [Salmonella enterica subsp. enterica serovar Panama]ECX6035210.1 hypothetical protein [Salmonella enterica subsp. enterica serovar Panama]EGX1720107.1 hypothetical protein [Salmonella enterica subsp. enterica serovar Panama]